MRSQAYWLNGRGVGARWDGTYNYAGQGSSYMGSCDGPKRSGTAEQIQGADRANLQRFINAQMAAYEKANGWIFWTWKTEAAPEWDYRALANAGIIKVPAGPAGERLPFPDPHRCTRKDTLADWSFLDPGICG